MSRLPTLSTPGRTSFSSPTSIPTPITRRSRSSLSNSHHRPPSPHDPDMDAALVEVLSKRASVLSSSSTHLDESTSHPATNSNHPPSSYLKPRTPAAGIRPKTPSNLGIGNPATPSASRPTSRLSLAGRVSISGATPSVPVVTPRRTSLASSTTSTTTPYARRPESRASLSGAVTSGEGRWAPVVGDRVRVSSLGMEGTLRYLGTTDFRDGVWAGIELEGGFAGKGKNDGTVEGRQYFSCPPNCGMFVIASKLSAPTSGPSRPASVASSYRSLASNSISGRQTPRFEARRPTTTTPARASRTVSSSTRSSSRMGMAEEDFAPPTVRKTMLGNSTSSNAAFAEGKITAGSRASKYLGMTAKQLDSQKGDVGKNSLNVSTASTAVVTPKAPRMSMGGVTPARARPSIGGSLSTPKARGPRISTATEMMPPPPSPGHMARVMSIQALEEEVRELRLRNTALEEEAKKLKTRHVDGVEDESDAHQARLEELRLEYEKTREEVDSLRYQLSASQADAADANRLAEELTMAENRWKEEMELKIRELEEIKREAKLAKERAEDELQAAMEAKTREVMDALKRVEEAELEAESSRQQVELLESSGLAIIEVQEQKQAELEAKVAELKNQLYKARDDLEEARSQAAQSQPTLSTNDEAPSRDLTAVEIDNETLRAQIKHLQSKISHLEEDIDETRASAEMDIESWRTRHAKAKEAEKSALEQVKKLKVEMNRLNEQAAGAKARVEELQAGLKESQTVLEEARAEIEGLRKEEGVRVESEREVERLRGVEVRAKELENKVESLEAEVVTLQEALIKAEASRDHAQPNGISNGNSVTNIAPSPPRRPRTSTGSIEDAEKSIRGYRHIVQEMSGENAVLKNRIKELEEEVVSLKEEIKLLQEINEAESESAGTVGAKSKELMEANQTISKHLSTIKELEREVSELESLVEAKIYREDELEQRAFDLARDRDRWREKANALLPPASLPRSNVPPLSATSSTSTKSISTLGETNDDRVGTETGTRCELCEGPHDLDVCPVLSGETLGGAVDENGANGMDEEDEGDEDGGKGDKPSPLAGKNKVKKWCADCESTEHNTIDCPLAEDVF